MKYYFDMGTVDCAQVNNEPVGTRNQEISRWMWPTQGFLSENLSIWLDLDFIFKESNWFTKCRTSDEAPGKSVALLIWALLQQAAG